MGRVRGKTALTLTWRDTAEGCSTSRLRAAGPATRRRPAKRGAAAGTATVATQDTIDMTGFPAIQWTDHGVGVAVVSFVRRRGVSTTAVRSGAELLRVEVTDASRGPGVRARAD